MRRRHLRPSIEKTLIAISMLIFILIGTLNDYELIVVPFILLAIIVLLFNIYILKTYGRGLWMDAKYRSGIKEE